MKKITIITRQEKFEVLKKLLNDLGIKGMTVSNVMGCGNQKGSTEFYRGTEVRVSLINKIKVDVIVIDSLVDEIVDEIIKHVATGKVGDGKIFISAIENAVRIRTGEKGDTAI